MFSSFVLFGKILVAGAICRFVIVIIVFLLLLLLLYFGGLNIETGVNNEYTPPQ